MPATSKGDGLTGVPDASTLLPAEFQVDSVRVGACVPGAAAPATTAGTATRPPARPPAHRTPTRSASQDRTIPALGSITPIATTAPGTPGGSVGSGATLRPPSDRAGAGGNHSGDRGAPPTGPT